MNKHCHNVIIWYTHHSIIHFMIASCIFLIWILKSDILIEQKILGSLKKQWHLLHLSQTPHPPTAYHIKNSMYFLYCKGDDAAHQVGITIFLSIHHQKVEILHHSKLIQPTKNLYHLQQFLPSFRPLLGHFLKKKKCFLATKICFSTKITTKINRKIWAW